MQTPRNRVLLMELESPAITLVDPKTLPIGEATYLPLSIALDMWRDALAGVTASNLPIGEALPIG